MALAETAELAVKLTLDGRQFQNSMTGIQRKLGGFGASVRKAAGNAGKALAVGAAAAVGAVTIAVKGGIESLASLESAVSQVDGAIKQMGQTGQVSGAQIARWANEIEASVQAAFDDKEITAGTAALIRYGKVAPVNLRRAMVVMTDLAAKTGDVSSASSMLAKALADPAKAAGRLARAGVVLSEAEQKAIEKAVKHGKVAKAQAVLLKALERTTTGAATAMNGPYNDAMKVLADVTEDAQRALAEGFLPVLQKAAKWISTLVTEHIDDIRNFGQRLADAFDKALAFAQKVPWDKIGAGLDKAARFAGDLFNAFANLPPDVQAVLIGLAGLEKLSGGAVSGAIGGVAKTIGEMIGKGLQTIFAANVTVVGKNVVGGGGSDLPGGAKGGGKGGGGKMPFVAPGVLGFGAALATTVAGDTPNDQFGQNLALSRAIDALRREIAAGKGGQLAPGGKETNQQQLDRLLKEAGAITSAIETSDKQRANDDRHYAGQTQATLNQNQAQSLVAFRAAERASEAGNSLAREGNSTLAAIRAKKTNFTANTTVGITTSVSVRDIDAQSTYRTRVARSTSFGVS